MYPPEEFLKHAAECKQMAKSTRDPTSKATWSQMAERWAQCADVAKVQSSATRLSTPARRSRRAASSVSHFE